MQQWRNTGQNYTKHLYSRARGRRGVGVGGWGVFERQATYRDSRENVASAGCRSVLFGRVRSYSREYVASAGYKCLLFRRVRSYSRQLDFARICFYCNNSRKFLGVYFFPSTNFNVTESCSAQKPVPSTSHPRQHLLQDLTWHWGQRIVHYARPLIRLSSTALTL